MDHLPLETLKNLQDQMQHMGPIELFCTAISLIVAAGMAVKLAMNSLVAAKKTGRGVLAMLRRKPKPVEPLDPLTASLLALLDGMAGPPKLAKQNGATYVTAGPALMAAREVMIGGEAHWDLIPECHKERLRAKIEEVRSRLTKEATEAAREAAAAKVSGSPSPPSMGNVDGWVVQCHGCKEIIRFGQDHTCTASRPGQQGQPPRANTGKVPVLDEKLKSGKKIAFKDVRLGDTFHFNGFTFQRTRDLAESPCVNAARLPSGDPASFRFNDVVQVA